MTYLGSEHFAGTPYGKLYAGPEHTPAPAGDSHVSR